MPKYQSEDLPKTLLILSVVSNVSWVGDGSWNWNIFISFLSKSHLANAKLRTFRLICRGEITFNSKTSFSACSSWLQTLVRSPALSRTISIFKKALKCKLIEEFLNSWLSKLECYLIVVFYHIIFEKPPRGKRIKDLCMYVCTLTHLGKWFRVELMIPFPALSWPFFFRRVAQIRVSTVW